MTSHHPNDFKPMILIGIIFFQYNYLPMLHWVLGIGTITGVSNLDICTKREKVRIQKINLETIV